MFGKAFYQAILRGATFGDATLEARREAHRTNPNSNTWGAYQCYGDPDHRLRDRPKPDEFVTISEAIDDAQAVRDYANIGIMRTARLAARLDEIEQRATARNWLGSSELRAALAEAWGELGNLGKAIEYYEAAVRSSTHPSS